jgi:TIR domain-containing protein
MTRRSGPDIFISHSTSDSSTAQAVSKALGEHGFKAWSAQKIEAGSGVAAQIEHAMRAADWYVVLVSDAALNSPNVNFEIGAAMGGHKKLLAVFLSRSVQKKAQIPLKQCHGILAEGLSANDIAERVAEAIQKEAA